MPNTVNATNITPPRVPIVDERTGYMSREWYRWFYNLFVVTGGLNQNIIQPDHGGTGTATIPENGQLLIGNSVTHVYNVADLGTGPGIASTVGPGTLSIENTGVLSFSGGTTGLTPATATTGDVTLAGTLDVDNGGTGATDAAGARANLSAAVLGANNDITSMSALTGSIQTPTYIDFDTTPGTPARQTGRIFWDEADGNQTLSVYMAGTNATMQIGEEMYYRIKASSAITEGQVVMFTGTVGASGALTGAPATGLTAETASYVMGIATENIALNGWGYVTSFGLVRGFDTTGGAEAWVNGQILYLDPTTPGKLTKTVPTAPNPKVQVCAVVYASGVNGSVFVRPTYGGKLGQFEGDVQITTPATNDLLQYDGTKWVNVTPASVIAGSSGAPVTKTANFSVAVGETWLINNKSGSTCTVTLPAAASYTGRVLYFQNYQAYTVISASSNVIPLTGGAAGTAILNAVAGDTATLVSNGTNWVMTQYVPNNVLLTE